MHRNTSLLLVLVIVGLVLPAGLAAAGDSIQQQTTEFELSELKQDGPHVSEMNPGERRVGQHTTATLLNYPLGPFTDFGGTSGYEQVTPSTTVQRNRLMLYVRSSADSVTDLTVHKVYWNEGTEERVVNGTTISEPAAVDVVHETETIEVSGMESLEEVSLRKHWDENRRVTVWVEGSRESARWTFAHNPSQTLMPVDITTEADFLVAGGIVFVLPMLGGAVLGWPSGKLLRRRMLVGPMKDRRWWLKVGVAVSLVTVTQFWTGLSSLLVSMGWVVGSTTFVVTLGSQLDRGEYTRTVNFRRLMTASGILEEGDDDDKEVTELPLDSTKVSGTLVRVIKHDGKHYAVAGGFRRAIARAISGPAEIKNWDEIEESLETEKGSSYDEEIPLSPQVDDPLDLQFPQLTMSLPSEDDLTVRYAGRLALAAMVSVGAVSAFSMAAWGTSTYGYLGVLPVIGWVVLNPNHPYCEFVPASGMEMRAEARNILLARDYDDATTNDELRDRLRKKEARGQAERIEEDNQQRQTTTETIIDERGGNTDRIGEDEQRAQAQAREEDKPDDDEVTA